MISGAVRVGTHVESEKSVKEAARKPEALG
jgi:hypothetical protein